MSVEGRLSIESWGFRIDRAARGDQATFDETTDGGVPLALNEVHQRFGQAEDKWGFAQRTQAVVVGGPVEQAQKPKDGQLAGPIFATRRQPFLIGTHHFE